MADNEPSDEGNDLNLAQNWMLCCDIFFFSFKYNQKSPEKLNVCYVGYTHNILIKNTFGVSYGNY